MCETAVFLREYSQLLHKCHCIGPITDSAFEKNEQNYVRNTCKGIPLSEAAVRPCLSPVSKFISAYFAVGRASDLISSVILNLVLEADKAQASAYII